MADICVIVLIKPRPLVAPKDPKNRSLPERDHRSRLFGQTQPQANTQYGYLNGIGFNVETAGLGGSI